MKRTVLIYSTYFYPSIGGSEITSRYLAWALRDAGYNVVIFTQTILLDGETELLEGYDIVRNSNKLGLFLSFFCKALCKKSILISKGGIAVIPCFVKILTQRPLVFYHEMHGDALFVDERGKVVRKIVSFCKRTLLRLGHIHIGVSSECLKSTLRTNKSTNQFVVYNCVNPEIIGTQTKKDIDILFVGRIIASKGVFVLIKALELIKKRGYSISPYFVGTGNDQKRLLVDLQNAGYDSNCFIGAKSPKELAEIYQRSKILVIPTTTHPEGMGMVIAEAFMNRLPVVGSDLEVIKEVIHDAGFVYMKYDAGQLADFIVNLLTDDVLYTDKANLAFARSQYFTFEKYSENIIKIFSSITN